MTLHRLASRRRARGKSEQRRELGRPGLMAATVATVAYLGLEARSVEVQVQLSSGLPAFIIVGLPDKAVAESRERVRAALAAIGLALPPKRITVNLSPADLPKEGSHYDLPIALGLLAAIGATDAEALSHYVAVGELSLDGRIAASPGVLLAAIQASSLDKGLICPAVQGSEASLGRAARRHCRSRPPGVARASQGNVALFDAADCRGRGARRRTRSCAGERSGSRQASARDCRRRRT